MVLSENVLVLLSEEWSLLTCFLFLRIVDIGNPKSPPLHAPWATFSHFKCPIGYFLTFSKSVKVNLGGGVPKEMVLVWFWLFSHILLEGVSLIWNSSVICGQAKILWQEIVQVIGLSCWRTGKEFQFGNFPLNLTICRIIVELTLKKKNPKLIEQFNLTNIL